MKNAKGFIGAKHFTLGELVDIGIRLSQHTLESMGLFDAVQAAEGEALWRLQAIVELAVPLTHISITTLNSQVARLQKQAAEPVRGRAKLYGGSPSPDRRCLPQAGTILIRPRYLHTRCLEIPCNSDGGIAYKTPKHFRFLVVEQPCKLLWLDEPGGPVYRNPSVAASKAAGVRENGWEWFGIAKV